MAVSIGFPQHESILKAKIFRPGHGHSDGFEVRHGCHGISLTCPRKCLKMLAISPLYIYIWKYWVLNNIKDKKKETYENAEIDMEIHREIYWKYVSKHQRWTFGYLSKTYETTMCDLSFTPGWSIAKMLDI